MNQKRMLNTSIWTSGQVAKLSISARLLYIGCITIADDDGRLKGNPAFLRSQIFPYDDGVSVGDVRKWLDEIVKAKLIEAYMVDDEEYLAHPKWTKHQTLRADRKKDSLIPPPDGNQVATSGRQPADGGLLEGKVSKGKASKDNTLTLFASFYSEYPNKKGKAAAERKWLTINPDEKLFAEIMAGLAAAKKSKQWLKDGGDYIPHPATWLNQKRWQDEHGSSAPTKTPDRF